MATQTLKEIFFIYTIIGMFFGGMASNLEGSAKDFFKFTFFWLPAIICGVFFSKKS
jgi:hypothetical protein